MNRHRFVAWYSLPQFIGAAVAVIAASMLGIDAVAADRMAFPENFVLRLAYYSVRRADTDLAVLSSQNIGTGFSFVDDLGGEDQVDVPQFDGYYRFNRWHRIEFGSIRIERNGRNLLTIDLDIGEQSFSIGDTVISGIDYEMLKLGYAFSFHHSPEVELSFTSGLHVTTYEFDYELVDGTSSDTADASGPLPMFGLRVAYAIDRRWSLHYLTEVLFVEAGDAEGSFQNYELSVQYKLTQSIMLGAGLSRFSMDLTSDDDDWNGRIADTHQGYLFYGSYYF